MILHSDQNFFRQQIFISQHCFFFLRSYKSLCATISLKIHFLHFHLGFFPKRFHQKIKQVEDLYQGRITWTMVADYVLLIFSARKWC